VSELAVDVHRNGDRVVVTVAGVIDVASEQVLEDGLEAAAGAGEVLLDLRGVTFMDSVGLGLLIRADGRARAAGTRLALRPSGPVQHVLDVAGVTGRFTLAPEAAP
jgi:anti-anti-sigma factor